jgi:hypothetical protein
MSLTIPIEIPSGFSRTHVDDRTRRTAAHNHHGTAGATVTLSERWLCTASEKYGAGSGSFPMDHDQQRRLPHQPGRLFAAGPTTGGPGHLGAKTCSGRVRDSKAQGVTALTKEPPRPNPLFPMPTRRRGPVAVRKR